MFKTSAAYFIAVANCRSFTKAAEAMFVTQPTISKRISLLEEELGFPLFSRTSKKVELTEKGRELYEYLAGVQKDIDRKIASLKGYTRPPGKTFVLGMLFGWTLDRMPTDFLNKFKKKHPDVTVLVEKHTYKDMKTLLLEGKLDATIIMEPEIQDAPSLECIPYYTENLFFLFSRKYPGVGKTRLEELLGGINIFAMGPTASDYTVEYIQKATRLQDLNVNIVPLPNFDSILTAVAAQQGCCLTGYASFACEDKKFVSYRSASMLPIVLAWRKDATSPLIADMVNCLKTASRERFKGRRKE